MTLAERMLKLIFAVNLVFLLLLGFSFVFMRPGSEGYYVALFTLIPVLLSLLLALVIYTFFLKQADRIV